MDSLDQEPVVPQNAPKQSGGIGPVIGIIVIVIVLALGGFYYFTSEVKQLADQEPASSEIVADEEEALRTQGTSNDLGAIEADVNASDFSGLDEASAGLDSELSAP